MTPTQPSLLDFANADRRRANPTRWEVKQRFQGATYDAAKDEKRLTRLLDAVGDALRSGGRWTLRDLQQQCGGSEAGISARIRDLKQVANGGNYERGVRVRETGHDIHKERVADSGLWEYWMSGG